MALAPFLQSPLACWTITAEADRSFAQGCIPLYLLFFSLEGGWCFFLRDPSSVSRGPRQSRPHWPWGALANCGDARKERLRIWASQCQE